MVITGFLIIRNYEEIGIRNFYKKKFSKILIIYLLANFIFILPKFFTVDNYSLKLFFRDIIWGKSYYHTWYLNTLIKIYLIFPILRYIVLKLDKVLRCKSIILITLVQFIIINNAYSILSRKSSFIGKILFSYLDRSLIIWIYYFILGGLIYKNFIYLIGFIKKYYIILGFLFLYKLIDINLKVFKGGSFENVNYVIGSPSSRHLIIYNLVALAVLYYFANLLVTRNVFNINKYIDNFSKYILSVYIIHPYIIKLNTLFNFNYLNYNFKIAILVILNIVLSFVVVYLYEKLITKIIKPKKHIEEIEEKIKVNV